MAASLNLFKKVVLLLRQRSELVEFLDAVTVVAAASR